MIVFPADTATGFYMKKLTFRPLTTGLSPAASSSGLPARMLLVFGILGSLLFTSAPSAIHAALHAASSAHGHSHYGGDSCHPHHQPSQHDPDCALLPPAAHRRGVADASGGYASLPRALPGPAGCPPLLASSPEEFFISRNQRKVVPQLANIPPPSLVS